MTKNLYVCCNDRNNNFSNNLIDLIYDDLYEQLKIDDYLSTIEALTQQVEELKKHKTEIGMQSIQSHSLKIDAVIKTDYIKYIMKYGVPEDGIFIPSRLAEFIDHDTESGSDCHR